MDILAHFDASLFFRALGLALVLEGFLWAGFPKRMLAALEDMRGHPERARAMGIAGIVVGLVIGMLAS